MAWILLSSIDMVKPRLSSALALGTCELGRASDPTSAASAAASGVASVIRSISAALKACAGARKGYGAFRDYFSRQEL